MAVYNQTLLSPDPLYLQPKSYDARADRKWFADFLSAGVVGSGDFNITYSGGTLVLNYAAGVAYVIGGNITDQGMYRQFVSAGGTITCPVADVTNPRIDTIILRVMDNAADASGFSEARIECVPGTATAGATLANLNGKNPLTALGEASKSFTVLAYILVPAGAAVLTNTATNVKDARVRATLGQGNMLSAGTPSGASLEWDYGSATVPTGFILQYGQAVSRTTFSIVNALASAAGYPHGAGDGSTTFNVADKRGRVSIGLDNMGGSSANRVTNITNGVNGATLGAGGGEEAHTTTTGEMPAHTHTIPDHKHGITNIADIPNMGPAAAGGDQPGETNGVSTNLGGAALTSSSQGSGGAHNNIQPSIMVNKILKT